MKYYCEKCDAELNIPWDKSNGAIDCIICNEGGNCQNTMNPIPEYETPKQYKKRTKKEWNGAVFFRTDGRAGFIWGVCRAETARREKDICVCANTPNEPPDDFIPEVD